MIITPVSFNGHSLNSADYETVGMNLSSPPAAKPVFVDNANADSDYSGGFTTDVRSCALGIRIKDYGDRRELVEQLRGWFQAGTEGDLVAVLDADGQQYVLTCVVQNLIQDATYHDHFTAMLQTGQSAWVSVDRDTDTWEATNATKTKPITVEGTDGVETQLSMDVEPTVAPGTGYFYQELIQLVGTSVDYGTRPWMITVNTAALVYDGKMRSDCYDLRIFIGNNEVRRWITNPNTDHTNIWFNTPLGPSYSLTLLTALDDETNPGILEFVVNANSRAAILAMPYQGIVYHGTEWFSYEGKNENTGTLFLKQRGAFGTALQAHNAGVVFKTIQNPVFMYYGNPSSTDPSLDDAQYDETKPVFDLENSTNSSWVYGASSKFYDPDHPARPGQWTKYDNGGCGPNSHFYYIKQDQASGDPAMGMCMGPYIGTNGQWWPLNAAKYRWLFYFPGGISTAALTGQKQIDGSMTAWPSSGFNSSVDGIFYDPQHASTLTTPGGGSWTAWTIATRTTYDHKFLEMYLEGGINGTGGHVNIEVLTVTLVFTAANVPASTLLGEVANYPLAIGIRNNKNGDRINLLFPMILNAAIVLDSEEKIATYHGINCHGAISLDDESRSVWIRLETGSNELEIIGDIGTIQVGLSWNRRRL